MAENRFVEWEEVYKGTCYGTLRSEVERIWAKGNIIVFDVDVIGGINLKRIFGGDACSIFVMPPSVEELRRRLVGRGTDAPEVIDRRVAKAEFELTKAPEFDHIVVNDSLDEAIAETTRDHRRIHNRPVMKRVNALFRVVQSRYTKAISPWPNTSWSKDCATKLVLVVSPQSPYKRAAELAARNGPASKWPERACAASRSAGADQTFGASSSCCPNRRTRSTRCAI